MNEHMYTVDGQIIRDENGNVVAMAANLITAHRLERELNRLAQLRVEKQQIAARAGKAVRASITRSDLDAEIRRAVQAERERIRRVLNDPTILSRTALALAAGDRHLLARSPVYKKRVTDAIALLAERLAPTTPVEDAA